MRDQQERLGRVLLITVLVAMLGRLLMLGFYPLMDTTEARYAEIARKMLELNDWITPWIDYDVPFWGKPPLSFWLTAASFKLFGIHEFTARLPHWLGGLLVAWLIWNWTTRHSHRQALYAVALLLGSILYFIAAGAVMTDMILVIGTTLAMRGFWLGLHGTDKDRSRERWLLFVGIGIGLLAKGPIAAVLIMLPIASWTIVTRNMASVWRDLPWLRGLLVALAIALPWYVLAELKTPGFLDYFLVGEHFQRFVTPGWSGDLYGSAHDYPRGTIWLFLFADLLPWTLLLPVVALFWYKNRSLNKPMPEYRSWRNYLLLWGLAPAVFFTASGNILGPYLLPGLPALAIWASEWLVRQQDRKSVERVLTGGVIFTFLLSLTLVVSLPISGKSEATSAKALVSDYQLCRASDEALVFLGELPNSASFYSRGEAQRIGDFDEWAKREENETLFVAVPKKTLLKLPQSFINHLELISHRGKYDLFVANSQSAEVNSCLD